MKFNRYYITFHMFLSVFAADCKRHVGILCKNFWASKYNCVELFCIGNNSVFEQIVFSYITLGKGLGHDPVYMFQSDSIVVVGVCESRTDVCAKISEHEITTLCYYFSKDLIQILNIWWFPILLLVKVLVLALSLSFSQTAW